jgi:hypothetical protein
MGGGVDANTVLNSVTVLGVAFLGFLSVRHGKTVNATHDAVKTRNGTTLGELASDDEDRRLVAEGEPPTEGPLH